MRICMEQWRALPPALRTANGAPAEIRSPTSTRPSAGCGWLSGYRCGCGSRMCRPMCASSPGAPRRCRSWFRMTESGKGFAVSIKASKAGLVLVLGLAVLAGCTVGPDYKLPDEALVNGAGEKGPFAGAKGQSALAIAPVPDDWWKLYDDARLDALIRSAIAANTDLRAAAANLERSRALP